MARVPNLFVAVVPPPDAVAPLAAAVDGLRGRFPEPVWVDPSRWHLTLCFLGPVEPGPELTGELAAVAATQPPVDLRVAGGGRFGDRVLWAGVQGDLAPLASAVAGAVRRAGFPVEDRSYRAHLTLARGRRRADLRPVAAALEAVTGPTWTADRLRLMRGGAPNYETVASWPLTGEPLS